VDVKISRRFTSLQCACFQQAIQPLHTRWPEDHSQTTPGGRLHWHINILDAKEWTREKGDSCLRAYIFLAIQRSLPAMREL